MIEKKKNSREIYNIKWMNIREDEVEAKGGKTASRIVISHCGGAAVLAVKDGKILLERQFRYPLGKEIWEIPAGKRDEGESFFDTAKRELEEETGLIPLNLTKITEIFPSPGYTDEIIGIFFADKFEDGKLCFDDTEDLSSEWVDVKKVFKMIDGGEIADGKSLVALLWYRAKMAEDERA